MIARSSAAGLLLVFLVGCGVHYVDLYPCEDQDEGHLGPNGKPDPCHEQDADGGVDGGADGGADGSTG